MHVFTLDCCVRLSVRAGDLVGTVPAGQVGHQRDQSRAEPRSRLCRSIVGKDSVVVRMNHRLDPFSVHAFQFVQGDRMQTISLRGGEILLSRHPTEAEFFDKVNRFERSSHSVLARRRVRGLLFSSAEDNCRHQPGTGGGCGRQDRQNRSRRENSVKPQACDEPSVLLGRPFSRETLPLLADLPQAIGAKLELVAQPPQDGSLIEIGLVIEGAGDEV